MKGKWEGGGRSGNFICYLGRVTAAWFRGLPSYSKNTIKQFNLDFRLLDEFDLGHAIVSELLLSPFMRSKNWTVVIIGPK